jgi:glycine cleavage system H protein
MSEIRKGYYYLSTDEWVKVEGDIATIGISDYAQHHLGDIVFIEMKEKGTVQKKGEVLTTIESVKSASDLYSPISGTLIEMNEKLEQDSGIINKKPYDEGWIAKIKVQDAEEIKSLMNDTQYEEYRKE